MEQQRCKITITMLTVPTLTSLRRRRLIRTKISFHRVNKSRIKKVLPQRIKIVLVHKWTATITMKLQRARSQISRVGNNPNFFLKRALNLRANLIKVHRNQNKRRTNFRGKKCLTNRRNNRNQILWNIILNIKMDFLNLSRDSTRHNKIIPIRLKI